MRKTAIVCLPLFLISTPMLASNNEMVAQAPQMPGYQSSVLESKAPVQSSPAPIPIVSPTPLQAPEATVDGATPNKSKWQSTEDIEQLLKSLDNVGRKVDEIEPSLLRKQVLNMLDVKLPLVEKNCDRAISYPLLKLSYNYARGVEGAESDLVTFASKLQSVGQNKVAFRGVSGACSIELKSLATSIIKVYRGSSYRDD